MELEHFRESQGPARVGQSWDGDAVRAIFAAAKSASSAATEMRKIIGVP